MPEVPRNIDVVEGPNEGACGPVLGVGVTASVSSRSHTTQCPSCSRRRAFEVEVAQEDSCMP
jgi:hypothetical protein